MDPTLWNYCQMEGSKTKKTCGGVAQQDNIFELVELLKIEQANTEVFLVQLM